MEAFIEAINDIMFLVGHHGTTIVMPHALTDGKLWMSVTPISSTVCSGHIMSWYDREIA